MRLWPKVAAATGAIAAVSIAVTFALDRRGRRDEAASFLIGVILDRLADPSERVRCEANPAGWTLRAADLPPLPVGRGDVPFVAPEGDLLLPPAADASLQADRGPPRSRHSERPYPFQFIALDADLHAARRGVPELEAELAHQVARGQVAVSGSRWSDTVEVVVPSPWGGGPCAYVFALGPVDAITGSLLPSARAWLLPGLAAAVAALLALAGVLRRVRRLHSTIASSALDPMPEDGDDEVANLARVLSERGHVARAQLTAAEQREGVMRDYLANTAHDVMTPLTALQAHLATLQEREREGQPADGAALTAAMADAQYLGSLLHNLAAAAHLDAGATEAPSDRVELGGLVERVVGRHRTIARRLQVALEFSVPDGGVCVLGDVTLLEQAVGNVVGNAVRYNRPGGHVAVFLEEAEGGRFTLRVLDDGPGVPEAELSRLVERGFRGRGAPGQPSGGHGLGLDIAIRVARRHGFELRFGPSEQGGLQVELAGRSLAPLGATPA